MKDPIGKFAARALAAILFASTTFLIGCVQVWRFPASPATFAPQHEKIRLDVALLIPEEIDKAKWEAFISPVDRARISFGPLLRTNIENVARSAFSNVQLMARKEATPSAKAILTPKLVSIERTQPPTIGGDQTTTMILNWTLTSNRGDVVWAETVKGESTTKMGFNPKKSAKQQSEEAAQMLFRDSYAKLLSSRQIRDFVAKQ